MISEFISEDQRDSVAIISINHPEKSNALSREMVSALSDTFLGLGQQPNLRAIILTASGDEAFCAGTDTTELTSDESYARELSGLSQTLFAQIENSDVPVIAAVNGIAAGVGCELVLACHLRIASNNAEFSLAETKARATLVDDRKQRQAREVAERRVLERMPPERTISAEEALQLGLINRIVPAIELPASAEALAREIAQLAPLAIRACLKAVIQGNQLPLAQGLALEAELFASLFATEDVREGTSAFLEKRPPVFTGK